MLLPTLATNVTVSLDDAPKVGLSLNPEIAALLIEVIRPCWSTVILTALVDEPYVPGVTAVSSKSILTLLPSNDVVIPVSPLKFRVSFNKLIPKLVELSSDTFRVVAIIEELTLVSLPCWSTVKVGITVDEPYVPGVTAVSSKSIDTESPLTYVVIPVSPETVKVSPKSTALLPESPDNVIVEFDKFVFGIFPNSTEVTSEPSAFVNGR